MTRLVSFPGTIRATVLGVAMCWLGAIAPAFAQAPLINEYNLFALSPPNEVFLKSSVDCGTFRCDIAYSIVANSVDRLVKVRWLDRNGEELVSGTNNTLSNFWNHGVAMGPFEATQWSKSYTAAVTGIAPSQAVGTADFTGTAPGVMPCGTTNECDDAEYYFWPNPFAPDAKRSAAGARMQRARPTVPTDITHITGTLATVAIDLSDPELAEGNRQNFLQFSSSVEAAGTSYRYRYAVTNFTELVVPFEWPEAGLSGELPALGSTEVVSTRSRAPIVLSSLPSWRLQTEEPFPLAQDFAYALDILAPVPEPRQWLQLVIGIAIVAAAFRSRLKRRT